MNKVNTKLFSTSFITFLASFNAAETLTPEQQARVNAAVSLNNKRSDDICLAYADNVASRYRDIIEKVNSVYLNTLGVRDYITGVNTPDGYVVDFFSLESKLQEIVKSDLGHLKGHAFDPNSAEWKPENILSKMRAAPSYLNTFEALKTDVPLSPLFHHRHAATMYLAEEEAVYFNGHKIEDKAIQCLAQISRFNRRGLDLQGIKKTFPGEAANDPYERELARLKTEIGSFEEAKELYEEAGHALNFYVEEFEGSLADIKEQYTKIFKAFDAFVKNSETALNSFNNQTKATIKAEDKPLLKKLKFPDISGEIMAQKKSQALTVLNSLHKKYKGSFKITLDGKSYLPNIKAFLRLKKVIDNQSGVLPLPNELLFGYNSSIDSFPHDKTKIERWVEIAEKIKATLEQLDEDLANRLKDDVTEFYEEDLLEQIKEEDLLNQPFLTAEHVAGPDIMQHRDGKAYFTWLGASAFLGEDILPEQLGAFCRYFSDLSETDYSILFHRPNLRRNFELGAALLKAHTSFPEAWFKKGERDYRTDEILFYGSNYMNMASFFNDAGVLVVNASKWKKDENATAAATLLAEFLLFCICKDYSSLANIRQGEKYDNREVFSRRERYCLLYNFLIEHYSLISKPLPSNSDYKFLPFVVYNDV